MIDLGLAILVGFSPLLMVLLLVAALTGTFEFRGPRSHRLPPLTPFVFVGQGDALVEQPRQVLASDRERDAALASISYAVGEGRLSLAEAEPRIGAVLHSRHRHELADLTADLPARTLAEGCEGRETARQKARLGWVALAAAVLLAAVAVQAATGLWELWPVAVAAFVPLAVRPRR